MSGTAKGLIAAHPGEWRAATTGAFLDGVADGTLAEESFDRWLEQDHAFVDTLVRAWGVLLAAAPSRDFALLCDGIAAFVEELGWFRGIAERRGLRLDGPAAPATDAYNEALMTLAARPYPEAITAMWAIEAAYLAAWDSVAPGPARFTEYVTHWANDGFAGFVAQLAEVVDRELPDGATPAATDAFLLVVRHESAFWRMTTTSA